MEVFTSCADLLEAVQSLPPPAAGHRRVFRGQTHDYPTMTPTALRGQGAADRIWPLYASKLATALGEGVADGADALHLDLDTMLLWVDAIKQHYGPGTAFLDVTHSIGVAAWFALHQAELVESQAIYGPPGPYDPQTDSLGVHEFVRHAHYDDAPAYLYVIDAVEGTAAHELEHGVLFDLALAPEPFSASARIRAQQACLVYADPAVDGGDLSPLFAPGTPLRVAWPLEGCAEVSFSTNQVFPPATVDDWYARFVAVPLAPNLPKSRAATVFDHPIAVSLYLPAGAAEAEDSALLEDLTYRFVIQRPALLRASLHQFLDAQQLPPQLHGRFAEATALLLEGPMMTTVPPISRLNLGLLVTGLADTAPAIDFVSGRPVGEVALDNVFVEVSPLDAAGWETVETPEPDVDVTRGVWLVREGERFFVMVHVNRVGATDYTVGPVEVTYDARSATYACRGTAPGARWLPIGEFDLIERAFFKALALVRMLSPRWKVSAAAQLEVGLPPDPVTSIAAVEWALGEILSLRQLAGPISSYHVLRHWGSDEPFYGGASIDSPAVSGGLEIKGARFARIPPAELMEAAAAELATLEPPTLPSRNAPGATEGDRGVEEAQTVVQILRERAHDDAALIPYLAAALDVLGNAYAAIGLRGEAVSAGEEAVELFGALREGHDRFMADHAAALANLGTVYHETARHADAISATEQAVALYRRLATVDPNQESVLARVLSNLGNCYSAAGRSEEALTAAEDAVALARRLAAVDPEARPFLATALSNLGGRYGEVGRSDDRLAAAEEAVATFRTLDGDAFAPNFGAALRNVAICYHLAGRKEDAVAAAEDAVRVYTRLAADNPQFAPVLADAIGDLGGLSGAGRSA